MTARVASSRLIGRSAEFAEFAALADAADGRPTLASGPFRVEVSGVPLPYAVAHLDALERARLD